MGTARPLFKVKDADERCAQLERALEKERRLRKAAEARADLADKNAKRFHALLLQARVALINQKEPS